MVHFLTRNAKYTALEGKHKVGVSRTHSKLICLEINFYGTQIENYSFSLRESLRKQIHLSEMNFKSIVVSCNLQQWQELNGVPGGVLRIWIVYKQNWMSSHPSRYDSLSLYMLSLNAFFAGWGKMACCKFPLCTGNGKAANHTLFTAGFLGAVLLHALWDA